MAPVGRRRRCAAPRSLFAGCRATIALVEGAEAVAAPRRLFGRGLSWRGYCVGMDEASGAVPPEGDLTGQANGRPSPDAGQDRRAAQLEGIERDLDTVDAALTALDSDDLERAEGLATTLEESAGERAVGSG